MVIKNKDEDQIKDIVKNLLKEISLKKYKSNVILSVGGMYEKRRNKDLKYDSFCR